MRTATAVMIGLLALGGAVAAQAKEPSAWRRIPSNFGLPVWIPGAEFDAAQKSNAKRKTVHVLIPGPMQETPFNPAAAYSIERETYHCDEGSMTVASTYYDEAGKVIKEVDEEQKWFPPGTRPVSTYRLLCDREPLDEKIELKTIGEVLAYPKPARPPAHP